jgi:hypothetical protein
MISFSLTSMKIIRRGSIAEQMCNIIKFIKNMEMEDPDQPASAVDPTGLLSKIRRDCRSEGGASRLALDAQFMNARFRAHKILRLIDFVFIKLHITLSARVTGRAFKVGHSAVNHA